MELGYSAEALTRTLCMLDLPYWMDETYLYTLFAATGQLVSAKVARNKTTGTSEGYAYVEFATQETADGVLRGYNGHPIPNTEHSFRLSWATASGRPSGAEAAGGPDHSIFCGDLAPDVSDYVLTEKFRQYFPSVRSAKVITDPVTGRSKGYGFVRFGNESERDRALGEMAGHLISNRPIRVSIATAKKNTVTSPAPAAATATAASGGNPHPSEFDPNNTTLFIGGLSAAATEEELQAQFGRYGDIIYVKIPPGKGCGFVQYVHRSVAEVAMTTMQSQVVGGSSIRISWGRSSSRAAPSAAAASSASYNPYSTPSAYPSSAYTDPYAAYGAAAASRDPYAAYAASYSQGQDYSAYSAYPSAAAGPAANGLGAYGGAASSAASAHAAPKVELRDPLASIDVRKLNEAYIQQRQAALLGSFLR